MAYITLAAANELRDLLTNALAYAANATEAACRAEDRDALDVAVRDADFRGRVELDGELLEAAEWFGLDVDYDD